MARRLRMLRTKPIPFYLLLTSMLAVTGAAYIGVVPTMASTGDVDQVISKIQSIRTVKSNASTFVDFDLSGKTYATIASSGKTVNLTFANTKPSSDLAQHIDIANALGQMGISKQTGDGSVTTVSLSLAGTMNATLASIDGNGIRLCLTPIDAPPSTIVSTMVESSRQANYVSEQPAPTVNESPNAEGGPHLYDLDAYNSDAASLFKSLASQSKTNIVLIGKVENKVTIHFAQMSIDRAVDLLAKASGLSYIVDNGAYVVGSDKDLAPANPNDTPRYHTTQRVYECNYVDASTLAASLISVFDKHLLHVSIGAIERSTSLLGGTTSQGVDQTGGSGGGSSPSSYPSSGGGASPSPSSGGSGGSGGGSVSGSTNSTGRESREVILYGNSDLVGQAYTLCGTLDRRRKQVKIDVNISDVSLDDLKNLGIQWQFPQFGVHEGTPNGISFGSFPRDPLNFEAQISAL